MVRTCVVVALLWLPVAWGLATGIAFHLGQRDNGVIISSGEPRTYLLHVPENLDPARRMPLVISLHGAGAWPAVQRDVSGWHHLADEERFIVVFPSAMRVGGTTGARAFNIHRPALLEQDVRFIADLIDALSAEYNVDAARIYVDGLSGGAGMAYALSCTLGERIAAVGMVASALLLAPHWCPDPRPMPLMMFHGMADTLAPYRGGTSIAIQDPAHGVEPFIAAWARRNGCTTEPGESVTVADITRRAWSGCTDDATVILYSIPDGGHTWPGGPRMAEWILGLTNQDIDATRELWAFFQVHSKARPD